MKKLVVSLSMGFSIVLWFLLLNFCFTRLIDHDSCWEAVVFSSLTISTVLYFGGAAKDVIDAWNKRTPPAK